jgi:small nuclear ribonucleoprotein (snRNP)-like protein
MEKMVNVSLKFVVEIDHHVPAKDNVKLVERSVGREIVLREDNIFPQ